MKKLILFLSILIIIPTIVNAQFSGGDGSINNPYLISTARQFDSIRYVSPNKTTTFKLIADINLDDLGIEANGNWTTISISTITGAHIRLDGDFHTIRNMRQYNKINQDQGLFKNISNTASASGNNIYIKNLTLKNFQIIDTAGTRNFGAGRAISFLIQSMNLSNQHKLFNITIDSSKIDLRSSNTSYSIYVGGLIATGSFDSVYQCAVINSSIKVVNAGQYSTVGAVYGGNNNSIFKIYKTFANNITIDWKGTNTSSGYLGAFTGRLTNPGNTCIIQDCYFIGNIKVNTTSGGTIVGFCYSIESNSISTYRCYSVVNNISTHSITKRGWTTTSRNIYNSYFNYETIGTTKGATTYSNKDSAFYKNTSQLKNINTYNEWDFNNIWKIDSFINEGYPTLRWYVPPKKLELLTPSVGEIYNIEQGQDSIYISWSPLLDSIKIYMYGKYIKDSITVYSSTNFLYKIPFNISSEVNIIIKNIEQNVSDSAIVFILGGRSLEIDTLYVEKEKLNIINGGKSSLDKIANKTSTSFGDVLTIKSISTGIDTINFYIEQENGVWYYLGKKKADTTHTPNVTYFTYVLKDHSPKCTCHKAGAKERGGGGPDEEGDTSDPFTPPNEFVFDEEFDEKHAFLSISGPFSAHPYRNMVCNGWIGTAWDLQYILDVSCGWVSSWKAKDCKEGHRSISGWFNGVVSYGNTSSEEFNNNIYIYKEFTTSGAFTYSISGYNVTLTSILTGQSRTFDMKKLDVLGGGFFAGGSGAIHPPFAVSKMNFGGKPYLLIGTKAEGRLLNPYRDELPTGVVYSLGDVISTGPPFFYMFAMDSRFAYTLIQHRGSYSPAWGTYGAGGAGGANFSVNTQKTRYRGVHSKNGIWKYGNSQGIKP